MPLAIADATSLTEAGYIGDDIESVVSKLLVAADNDVERAEHGIIFIVQSEYAGDFLPKILGETLEAILSMFGDRIGKLLLKQAVEQNVCNHILASDTDIDAQTYQQMRGKSYQEVLRTNGQISFPEVLRQQKRL